MEHNFSKFRRKLLVARIIKAGLAGGAVSAAAVGLCMLLTKKEIWMPKPPSILLIAIGAGLLVAQSVFFLLRLSDRRLSRALDQKFSLQERVETMVAFRGQSGEMLELQRSDTEQRLGEVAKKSFGFRRLWAYLLILCIGLSVLAGGCLVKPREEYVAPPEVIPFELSEIQLAGLEELIRFVDASQMEAPYKTALSHELHTLTEALKAARTEPKMQEALALSLTEITDLTYDASSMTEILNAMWATGDSTVRALAKALDTSRWTDPDWGEFTEKYNLFRKMLVDGTEDVQAQNEEETKEPSSSEANAALLWRVESASLKLAAALNASSVAPSDPLYGVLNRLLNGAEGDTFSGLALLAAQSDAKEAAVALEITLDTMATPLYDTISAQKVNTNVGEYVLRRLSLLFGIPIPAFERPTLTGDGLGGEDEGDREDDKAPTGGGVGEGVTFGSDDLILDPLTGEYVTYGELYSRYSVLMQKKLEDERYGYTEKQKKAIEKYFALLYSGFDDKEGD